MNYYIIMSLKINKDVVLSYEEKTELDKIVKLYKSNYPEYTKWKDKKQYFDKENELRHNYIENDEYIVDGINLGYILDNKKIVLDDRFIKFIFLRFDGLQKCICKQ